MNRRLIAVTAERDALLAALRELVPIVSAYCAATNDEPSAVSLRIARAVIANATKE